MPMSTIEFICPHCSHKMKLPASLIGKNGTCPSCKASVIVTNSNDFNLESETTVTTELLSVHTTKSDSPAQTPEPVTSTGTDAIRERITRLQIAKERFEQADYVRAKAMKALEDATSAVSSVYNPIGSSVLMAFTLGEIDNSPLFADLLEANRKLQQFQNDLLALESGPNANMIQKTKAKTQQLIVQQKIKQGEKLINSEQYKLGKKIVDSKIYDSFICSTTTPAFEKLNTLQSNIVEAENNLKVANSSLGELNNELMSSVPLNEIEGVQTFDIAIGVSERQLAEIKGGVATEIEASHPTSVNLSNRSVEAQQTGVRTKRQKNNKFGKKVVVALTSVVFVGGIGFALYSFLSDGSNSSNVTERTKKANSVQQLSPEYITYNEIIADIYKTTRDFDAGITAQSIALGKINEAKDRLDSIPRTAMSAGGVGIGDRLKAESKMKTIAAYLLDPLVLHPNTDIDAISKTPKIYDDIKAKLASLSDNAGDDYKNWLELIMLDSMADQVIPIPLKDGGPDLVNILELEDQIQDAKSASLNPYSSEWNEEFKDLMVKAEFLAKDIIKFRQGEISKGVIRIKIENFDDLLNENMGVAEPEAVSALRQFIKKWNEEVYRSAN